MDLGATPAAARCHASRPVAQTPSAVKRAALAVLGRCCGSEVLRERASPHWRGRAPCLELVVGPRMNLNPGGHRELDPLAEQQGSTMEDWAHPVSREKLSPRERPFRRCGPRRSAT